MTIPEAQYFVTACTAKRQRWFSQDEHASVVRDTFARLVDDRDVRWLAATVMPDHVHLLFELADRLSFDRLLAKFKGLVTRRCRLAGQIWQENVFEHRVRPDESLDDYVLYIFMNPYHAALVDVGSVWPWWFCSDVKRFCIFDALQHDGTPQPEWLGRVEAIERTLQTCE